MVANFFNEFKTNLSFFKNKIIFLFKNLNYLVIFDLFCLLFIIEILFKINIIIFVTNFVFITINYLIGLNYIIVLSLFLIVSIRNLIINKIYGKFTNSVNSNKLYLNFLYIVYSRLTLKANFMFLVNYLNLLFLSNSFAFSSFNTLFLSNFKNLY